MTFSRTCALFLAPLFAALAAAQTAPQCFMSAANVVNLRVTGEAEPVGDLVVSCTGGSPTPSGQLVPTYNFTVTSASVPITSRLLTSNWSEAFLLVDEPPAASQLACTGTCSIQGTGTGSGTYSGVQGRPNIFQAQQSNQNVLTFTNVPFDPPGVNGGVRIFRFTNVRINASSLNVQAQVTLSLTIIGTAPLAVNPSQAVVATAFTPFNVTLKGVQTGANGLAQFSLSFTESYASSFKTRTTATDPGVSPPPANQNAPNQFLPGSESHFYNSALPFVEGHGNLGTAGLADNGTRLMVTFTGIPQGVSLNTNALVSLLPGSGVIRLVSTDANGAGSFQASANSNLQPDTNGTIRAVFEVLVTDPQTLEHADIPFTIFYSSGAPRVDSISSSAGLAPQSQITTADLRAPLPRFSNLTSLQISSLSISPGSAPQGSVGAPYTAVFTASGGSSPYTWSAGNLPPGLSITANSGIIGGTPTVAGSFQITVGVTDATQSTTAIQLPLTIVNGFVITTTAVPNGTVSVPYSTKLASAGGQGTVTFSANTTVLGSPSVLPDGLSLAPDGTLSGTPTKVGTYSFSVTAFDQQKNQATQSYKMTISPALVITTVSPLSTGVAGGGQLQITIQAQGGTQPYTFSVVGTLPPGLTLTQNGLLVGNPTASGTFNFGVTVTDAQHVQVTKQFQITFTPAPSLLQVSSTQLNFSALLGGDAPAPQTLVVTSSSVAPVNFSVQLDSGTTGSAVPRWVTVQASQGVTPSGIVVVVDQSTLVIGTADARLLITIPGDATRVPVAVGIHLDIAAGAPVLDVSPNLLRLRARAAAPGVQTQVLLVRNAGGGGPINFRTDVAKNSPWITGLTDSGTFSTTPGQTSFNKPTPVTVTVNTQGLKPGTVSSTIYFSGTAAVGLVSVPISIYVADAGPYLGVDTRGLRFQARQGAGSSYSQTVRILNLGDPGSTVNWTANLLTGNDWLFLSTARGTSTTAQPGSLVLSPGPNTANLSAGPHYALIQISDQLSLNSPQYIVAVLDIAPATALPQPELSTGYLYFAASQGNSSPIGGSVKVFTSSLTPANFQVATATTDGSNWLQASPSSFAASTATPGQVTVVVNPSGLSAGIYKGQINIAMSGVLRTKDVTLVVLPGSGFTQTLGEQSLAGSRDATCTASHLALTLGNLTTSFDLPAQFPAMISVQLTDNCNSPVPNATVVASFSNGDVPLTLFGDGVTNIYSDTWQPGVVQPNMSVTIRANAPTYPEASLVLTGNVEANVAPVLNRGGTVNNSNPLKDAPLAPGTVIALYGANLASGPVSPGVIPLLTSINGSYVIVGGTQLPLYYASPMQINAQLPVELPLNRPQTVIVASGGGFTLPDTLNITAVSPGVAAFQSGALIAQNLDTTLVDAGHPAHPGDFLTMYLVGMGATNPSTATGQQTTGPLEPVNVQPTVTVDGQPATVSFAGLSPGGIGLYQINFQVPAGAQAGSLNVFVMQGDVVANITTLPVVR